LNFFWTMDLMIPTPWLGYTTFWSTWKPLALLITLIILYKY